MATCALAHHQTLLIQPCPRAQASGQRWAESSTPACFAQMPRLVSPALTFKPSIAHSSGIRQKSLFLSGTPLRLTDKVVPGASKQHGALLSTVCAGGVADIGDSDFEQEVLQSDVPVLVDFHASWCGPCKLVAPLMNWAAETYGGKLKVVKVDVEANPKVTEKYRVYGLPTVLIFESGKLLTHNEGAITKVKLDKLLKDKLPALA